MESRSIAELTDASETLQILAQVVCLAIVQYLRNQGTEQTYKEVASAMNIPTGAVKFSIERLASIGVLTSYDTSTFAEPNAGLANINPDMPHFARMLLEAIWPNWNEQEQAQEAVISGQLL